jgi:hypothetical protein
VQSTVVLVTGYHLRHSVPGIIWTAVTAAVMFALAVGKRSAIPCCTLEGRVTISTASWPPRCCWAWS